MTDQQTPATRTEPTTQVWVLSEESYLNSCSGDGITLFPSQAAAEEERLRRVHKRWGDLPFEDVPAAPPADPEEAIEIYNEAREGERLNTPWSEEIAAVPGSRARFLWPDPEGADPAIEIGGILVGVRQEPKGLVVWIGADGADITWPRDPETGTVRLEVVVNGDVMLSDFVE